MSREKMTKPGELKYCKEHRTIHCSCQQREIDRLAAENREQQAEIERLRLRLQGYENRPAAIKCPKCSTVIKAV